MFGLGWPEVMVCALVGFFVFGPERLPGVARDAARLLQQLRGMAQGVTEEIKQQLPEGQSLGLDELRDLRDLHPKRMMSKAFFDDEVATTAVVTATTGAVSASSALSGNRAVNARAADVTFVPPYDVDAT